MIKFPRVLFAVALAGSVVSAQGGQGGGSGDSGAPPLTAGPRSPLEEFASKLKLDAKTQVPAVDKIIGDAATEASPIGMQLLELRQKLVNAELAGKADDVKAAVEAYTVAAAKMAGIEAQVFAKVYALLKPNQQGKAAQAFDAIAGLFQAPAPRAARSAPRGGGGLQ